MPFQHHMKRAALILLASSLLVLQACAPGPVRNWHDAGQMVLVLTPNWNAEHGQLRRYQRDANGWHQVGDTRAVSIGKSGAAWGIGLTAPQDDGHPVKREGDGRSPAGVFAIGTAFGYKANLSTQLAYAAMHADSYCVDVSGSPYYNRIVRASEVGREAVKGASEHMRLDLINHGDPRYRMGFVIEHNPAQEPMAGSCIFAHLWNPPGNATVGCTAMSPATMTSLLRWLQPAQHPLFILLPEEAYLRLRKTWQLPKLDADS